MVVLRVQWIKAGSQSWQGPLAGPRAHGVAAQPVGRSYGFGVDQHLVQLAGDWALWRNFAVRSAGFPVGGLGVFGADNESARLAEAAANPAFAEAVIWQNRSAYRTAVAKIADGGQTSDGKRRRRENVVAAYWQRYCSKNDTIGFFGPLGWGVIRDDGPAVAVRSRGIVTAREVHFESWCMEALASAIDPTLVVPLNAWPEVDLRMQLEARGNVEGLQALERMEKSRAAVAEAKGSEALLEALDAFDACFEELTGVAPLPHEGGAAGGRTPLYLESMRDLDVDLGPVVVAELAASLPVLFEASRWWCGRAFAHFQTIIAKALAGGLADRPFGPLFEDLLKASWEVPRLLAPELQELQRRCDLLVEARDDPTIASRAAAAFADHGPSWPISVFQSADVQIAAPDLAAIEAGEFLAVVGDFHGGNPLIQSMFAARFPNPEHFRALFHRDVGSPIVAPILPRNPAVPMTSRLAPDITNPDDIHLLGHRLSPVHIGHRALQVADLGVRGDQIVDPVGGFHAPLTDLFFLPVVIAAMQTFRPFDKVGPRITVGRTVLRRASWQARVAARPADASGIAAWAADLGLPRRVFCHCAGEPKPVYIDFHSRALTYNLHRMLNRAAGAEPEALVRFNEMLPAPDECWLEHDGDQYTSELRIVAVDLTRRGLGTVAT